MRKMGGARLLPILIAFLMLASTFAIFSGVSHGSESLKVRAPGDAGRILYIYGSNKTLRDEWREYLTGLDYFVDALPMDQVMDIQYWHYNLIILGDDAYEVPTGDLFTMYHSDVPVIGVGRGALNFVISLHLILYQNYYTHDTRNLTAPELFIYHTPNQILGVPGDLTIYSKEASMIYAFGTNRKPANQTLYMGYFSDAKDYSIIFQINSFIFYGYTQSPKYLTSVGDLLMRNIIYYMDSDHYYNIHISREYHQVTIDGKFTTIDEWWDYDEYYLDDSYTNSTSYYEDPFNLYILMYLMNTSQVDFISLFLDTNNSRTAGGVETSTINIIFSEVFMSVRWRSVNPDGTWSMYNEADGINIVANWSYYDYYEVAEIQISKSFLGIENYTDTMVSYGIECSGPKNLPTTFNPDDLSAYVTMYSPNNWTGQYTVINSPQMSDTSYPIIDGELGNGEWSGSKKYYIDGFGGYPMCVRTVTHMRNTVYFGGYVPNFTNAYAIIRFYFDTNGDGGHSPQSDDFEIVGYKNYTDNSLYTFEKYGTGSGWGSSQDLTNAEMALKLKGDKMYFELAISYSKLGLTPGTSKQIPMAILGGYVWFYYSIPSYANTTDPSTWKLTLNSPSSWDSNYMTFDAHSGSTVTVDGNKEYEEWKDAFSYYYYPSGSGAGIYISMKTDPATEKLYIAAYIGNPSNSENTMLSLAFDINNDSLSSEDFIIDLYYTNKTAEWMWENGGWNPVTPSGWTYAMDSKTYEWTAEIAINYSKLQITPGVEKSMRIYVWMNDDGFGEVSVPSQGAWGDSSTWNTIISSDEWGSTAIPEINPALLILLVTALLAVLARKRK